MARSSARIDWHRVVDALAAGFERASAAIELEQAVHGLDARSELELHPLIHAALRHDGWSVHPEVRFPRDRPKRRRSEGARCDLVITPEGTQLATERGEGAAFVTPQEGGWIEVKVVAQHRASGPNRDYASTFSRPPVRDVRKLAADPALEQAALLLVLFTADEEVASRDLATFSSLASMRGLPLAPRICRDVAIGDRLGNRRCMLALFAIERPLAD